MDLTFILTDGPMFCCIITVLQSKTSFIVEFSLDTLISDLFLHFPRFRRLLMVTSLITNKQNKRASQLASLVQYD